MIITVAGIKRSGSTAQFNMIRCLLNEADIPYTQHGKPYNQKDFGDNAIVKVHKFDKWLFKHSDYIFTTDRSDDEIFKSLQAFSGAKDRGRIKNMREHLDKWNRKADCYEYKLILSEPVGMMYSMCVVMNLGLSYQQILMAYDEFKSIKPPKEGYDPNTFLFHNHRRT